MTDFWSDLRMGGNEVYCFAYGSNLDEARMKKRCPHAETFGKTVLHGYRLLFKQSQTGAYATIEQDANGQVPGVIYKITAEDEVRLDRFEGVPRYYYKQDFLLPVWGMTGRKKKIRRNCIAYIMHEYRLLGEPSEEYFELIDTAYDRWGFDKSILARALESSIGTEAAELWLNEFYGKGEDDETE